MKNVVHGIAHITGGGLHENLERLLPEGVQVVIDRGSWPIPPVFTWLQRLGEVDQDEMDRVFNMGIGLVLIVRTVLCREHPPATEAIRTGKLADRPRAARAARRGLGGRLIADRRPWKAEGSSCGDC